MTARDRAPWAPGLVLGLAFLSVLLAVALAEVYAVVGRALGVAGWVAAALTHTVLGAAVAVALVRRKRVPAPAESCDAPPCRPCTWIRARPWRAYLPAALVLLGAAALAAVSALMGGATRRADPWANPAWILWIPLVEELVFRAGLGAALRARAGQLWGAWFASITFALAHAAPTWDRLTALDVGLPLGPFLLGLACEALYGTTGRLAPAVALHAACNATVWVFALLDERWLEWLGLLYS